MKRLLIHLFRLAAFAMLVSVSLFGSWVVAASVLPEALNEGSVIAWEIVDEVAEIAYYNLSVFVGAETGSPDEITNMRAIDSISTMVAERAQALPTLTPSSTAPQSSKLCDIPNDWDPYTPNINDTLNSIAISVGVSESIISDGNCLTTSKLTPGQKLYLPSNVLLASITPNMSATVVPSQYPTQTETSTATATPIPATTVPSATNVAATKTSLPSNTPKPASSNTATSTLQATFTALPTYTNTPNLTPSASSSPGPSATSTPLRTATPTSTATSGGPQPTATVDLSGCSYNTQSSIEKQVLDLLNIERDKVGMPPLKMQSQLRSSAREHSADMNCNDFVSHTGSNGTQSYDRITGYGYYPSWWGENIYMGYQTTPEQVVSWWMNSEPHRKNILHEVFIHIGIGHVAYGTTVAYTLNFGRP